MTRSVAACVTKEDYERLLGLARGSEQSNSELMRGFINEGLEAEGLPPLAPLVERKRRTYTAAHRANMRAGWVKLKATGWTAPKRRRA